MGRNRGSAIITILAMFVLFLSWISIVFNLPGGRFFKAELVLLVFFLFIALLLTGGVLAGSNRWNGLIFFYGLMWINLLVVYFHTLNFSEIVLPFLVTGFGFLVALLKSDAEEFEEKALFEEPVVEKEVSPAPKKTTKKKTATKKPAKKSKK